MKHSTKLFITSAGLFILGVVSFVVRAVGPGPKPTPTQADCVGKGEPSSGFVMEVNGKDCLLTPEFVDKLDTYQDGWYVFAWIGLFLVAAALVSLIIAFVVKIAQKRRAS